MTRLEEIDAELELLAKMLCCAEDNQGCACPDSVKIRAQMHRLHDERDNLPRQRRG